MLHFVAGSPLTSITIFGSCSKHFLLVVSQEDVGAAAASDDDDNDDDDDDHDGSWMYFPSLCPCTCSVLLHHNLVEHLLLSDYPLRSIEPFSLYALE